MIQVRDTRGGIQFDLANKYFLYSIFAFDKRFLCHLYWGSPLGSGGAEGSETSEKPSGKADGQVQTIDPATVLTPQSLLYHPSMQARTEQWESTQNGYALDSLPLEYPVWGTGDLREGACKFTFADGTGAACLEYEEYEISTDAEQPQEMAVLPQKSENQNSEYKTLRIRLVDQAKGLVLDLFYVIGGNSPALIRWARFLNLGGEDIWIEDPASASLDTPASQKCLVSLHGDWGRERHVQNLELSPGSFTTGSINGASGNQSSPFLALADLGAGEHSGLVQSLALAYSGNFIAGCSVDSFGFARLAIGIQKLRLKLQAKHGVFDTPAAVLVCSNSGLSGMSQRYHSFIRSEIRSKCRLPSMQKIILNSWEAMYFNINEEKILKLAGQAKSIGAELLVLDDGWFSARRSDNSSLGDWWYNKELFPNGIGAVAQKVHDAGIEFGLWIEPEMVSPDSDLYRKHPDWAIQIQGREKTQSRQQLVLDLTNKDVQKYLFESISRVFEEAKPYYVKWDMNRSMTEPGSLYLPPDDQGSFMHRYILALYSLLERIQAAFPDIYIEGCAGGGGRFDLGLVRFFPRFWTSDQTDAVERLPIQYGTSLVFPPETMGSHVSAVPNHQVGRVTPARSRCLTALPFSFGFELDPAKMSEADLTTFAHFSEVHKKHRKSFHEGRFFRLKGPLEMLGGGAAQRPLASASEYAWYIITQDNSEIFLFYFCPSHPGVQRQNYLRLSYLSKLGVAELKDTATGKIYPVELLEERGLPLPSPVSDYQCEFWHFTTLSTDI